MRRFTRFLQDLLSFDWICRASACLCPNSRGLSSGSPLLPKHGSEDSLDAWNL